MRTACFLAAAWTLGSVFGSLHVADIVLSISVGICAGVACLYLGGWLEDNA